jgi:hypothetical protein
MTAQTVSDRVSALLDKAFQDLADSKVPLSDVVAQAIRIARLRGDYDNLHWLEMELRPLGDDNGRNALAREFAGHYTGKELERRNEEVVEAYIAERTAHFPTGTDAAADEEKCLAMPVREIEEKIAFITGAADGPEIPSGMHTLDVHAAYTEKTRARMLAMRAVNAHRQVLARIEHRVHEFLSATEKQVLYGQVNADIFERNRQYVDRQLADLSPRTLDQVTSAYRRAHEGDEEARSQALLSCRRALKSIADALYPPDGEGVVGADGREHDLTDDKWRNRLTQFVRDKLGDHAAGVVLQTQLDDLGRRLKGLGEAGSRGVHANVTEFELNQAVIQTYLTICDLMRLRDDDSGLLAVAQGFTATAE